MLPSELLQCIFAEAASGDPKTAHTLAYVSHQACECTKSARWCTLAIDSVHALANLLRLLHTLQHRNETWLSIPGQMPTRYTRHLFIDTETPETDLLSYLSSLSDDEKKGMVSEHDFLSLFPNVDVLSLGSAEMQAFSASLPSVSPVSLKLVYNGNETLLRSLFPPYPSASSPRGAYAVPEAWKACAPSLRRRLRHLHIIGIDPQSELTGLPMPIDVLEPLCAGSTSPGSFLHAYLVQPADASVETSSAPIDTDWTPGVTYLRYDTRKFSYRPTDIMASRLRPFFQQLDAEGENTLLDEMGASAMVRFDICWLSAGSPSAPQSLTAEERDRLNSAMFTGGWPRELRGAWTDRGQTHSTPQESFRYELQESFSNLYGWEAPLPMPGYILQTEGTYVDRIATGFSAKDRQVLDRAETYFSDAKMARTASETVVPASFRVRYPATFLHLGEAGAPLYVPPS